MRLRLQPAGISVLGLFVTGSVVNRRSVLESPGANHECLIIAISDEVGDGWSLTGPGAAELVATGQDSDLAWRDAQGVG